MKSPPTQFKDVPIGAKFDFVSGHYSDSFFNTCTKISPTSYTWESMGATFKSRVGSPKVDVYHVEVKA